MKILPLLALVFLCAVTLVRGQEHPERSGVHMLESARHRNDTIVRERLLENPPTDAPALLQAEPVRRLSARVFGYHPYWSTPQAHTEYDYSALGTIGYFSYEVDSATGGYESVHGWKSTPVIEYAHARGVKVVLVVTSFGYDANDRILGNVSRQQTMIDSLVALLRARGGDGVNIDFELVRGTQRANLVSFMIRLATAVRAAIPGAEISMATPAVDWSNAFDLARLADVCDYLLLMGYDYHWSGAPRAGPVAPLEGEGLNVTRSVDTYLATGMAPAKLLLAVPWYGYDWPTVDTARGSTTTGTGRAVFYADARSWAARFGRRFDDRTKSPRYTYTASGIPRQAWYDDSLSLALKYALAKSRGLGGIGIWALGYQGDAPEIWNGIKAAFASPSRVARQGKAAARSRFAPNPTAGAGRISISSPVTTETTLRVHDILGRIVLQQPVRLQAGANDIIVDLEPMVPGLYHYRMQIEGEQVQGEIRVR